MIEMLRELWDYQAWADATLWSAMLTSEAAREDPVLRERTLHVHHAQDAFLRFARGEPLEMPELEDFTDFEAVRTYGRQVLEDGAHFLRGDDLAWLEEIVRPPWKFDPPLRFTAGEGVLQAIMHSQHHRGQNAKRLRELGGEPPTTDMLLWVSGGRPAPDWS